MNDFIGCYRCSQNGWTLKSGGNIVCTSQQKVNLVSQNVIQSITVLLFNVLWAFHCFDGVSDDDLKMTAFFSYFIKRDTVISMEYLVLLIISPSPPRLSSLTFP